MSSGDIRRLIDMIKEQDGKGSGLDADMLRGLVPSSSSQPNVIPVTDSSGKIPNEFIDSESLGGGGSGAVTAPNISGPTSSKYGKNITLTASGSLTAFKDNGATIDHYEWILPDNTITTGNSITYSIPDDSSLVGETLVFQCKAVDTLGNESKYSEHDVTVSDNNVPIIDSIDWSSNDLYDQHTYTVTITAHDPDSEPLQYKVTCNDPNVTITPNDWDSNNSFNVSFPDYTEDTTVTFTYHVKDSTDEITQDEDKIVHDGLPIGDTGVFGGGYSNNGYENTIDYITISTLGNAHNFGNLTVSRNALAATSNGTNDRGVFGGGWNGSRLNTIDYITISTLGNAHDFGDLTVNRNALAATSNETNDRGVFGGGDNGSRLNTIDYITISSLGNAHDFGDLTVSRWGLAATSNGTNDRGVFGGGYNPYYNTIDYITIPSLGNASDFGDLTISRRELAATSNGTNDRGVFGGGYYYSSGNIYLNTIDYITISSLGNAHDFGDLTVNRSYLAATSNGTNDRGMFGGGYNGNRLNTIDYITISTLGNAHDFGDLTVSRHYLAATSNA